jgi:hypothetical protein
MNLTEMRALVRRDLYDENSGDYRWTDAEIERHIACAVKEFSAALPLEQKAVLATTPGSREVDISPVTGRVMVEALEYPAGRYPARYQRFAVWNEALTILSVEVPDGSDCCLYYGGLHTLDGEGSTLPARCEDLVAAGACGYAAVQMAGYLINRVNTGGTGTPAEGFFRSELKRLGRRNRVRAGQLYVPYYPPVSKSTDYGE